MTETGLEVILRKASNRCRQAQNALLDHVVMHIPVNATTRRGDRYQNGSRFEQC
jgi:hypothetical protein